METRKTNSAGGVVLNKQGEVLVVSQGGRSWSLPKGHIDEGEDALTAAKREIYEESGISNLEYVKDLGTYSRYRIGLDGKDDLTELKNMTMFLFRTKEETLAPVDVHNPEARWVNVEEVEGPLTHNKDKDFFINIKKEL
ncbi:NUDIX domain-containing protein [Candidatus Nomurabacteria bacterium]|nr:NUDIX domain-containing protein [Candidatus Nomurabacteria bacterium]